MPADCQDDLVTWEFLTDETQKAGILEQCKDLILAEWISQRPGSRPDFWWQADAPEKGRRRLGGVGDPAHLHLNYVEEYDHGVPAHFIDSWLADYFQGRAGRAIDPNDPPTYESQATFLQRHGLLTAEERRRLQQRDFEAETVR